MVGRLLRPVGFATAAGLIGGISTALPVILGNDYLGGHLYNTAMFTLLRSVDDFALKGLAVVGVFYAIAALDSVICSKRVMILLVCLTMSLAWYIQ